jgi:hypothetical protein
VKQRIVFSALAAITLCAPASAEPRRIAQSIAPGVLPPHEILTIVRSTDLDPVSPPMWRGAHYVLHALRGDGREVRVIVHARLGDIVAVMPVVAERGAPLRPMTGPYGPVGPRYISPRPSVVYEQGPPIIYEARPPIVYGPRPPAPVPPAPPDIVDDDPPPIVRATPPRVAAVPPAGQAALLPPPPERFPQRVPPAAAKRGSAGGVAAMPNQPPLPRPRPPDSVDASPMPPVVPDSKPGAREVAN